MGLWAIIENNLVSNIISASQSYVDSVSEYYQFVIEISGFSPQPSIGYTYNSESNTFTAPPEPVIDSLIIELDQFVAKLISSCETANGKEIGAREQAIQDVESRLLSQLSPSQAAVWYSLTAVILG